MESSVTSSIATSLGIGSGINTAALVDQLATATKAPRDARLTTKLDDNTAKVSALGTAINTISAFSTSLGSLISGGSLFTQPTSSNTNILSVSAVAGSRLSTLSATVEVKQIAKNQALSSASLAGSNATVGEGTLKLTTASGDFDIVIDSSNNTLAGLANAINGANSGVTASTINDSTGTRLVLKSATGAENAFSLELTTGNSAELGRFTFDAATYDPDAITGMTLSQSAQDAEVLVDGVTINKASNTFSDVISGVQMTLNGASPGTTITLGSSRPTSAITQAVSDFIDAYNEMKTALNEATNAKSGPLRTDNGMRNMVRQLAQITSTQLTYPTDGGPTTLAEIGVSTNRDGSLTLDTARLTAVMAANPDAVEAMFNPSQRSDNPLVQITSAVGATKGGTFTVTNLIPATDTVTASGMIDGAAALPAGKGLTASFFAAAKGLTFTPLGNVSSATIYVEPGLGGTLKTLKESLLSTTGALTSSQKNLENEKTSITQEQTKLNNRDAIYRATLTKQFTAMQTALLAYNATSSFLGQQIDAWNNSNNN